MSDLHLADYVSGAVPPEPIRKGYGRGLVAAGKRDEQVVAACHEGYRSCFFRQYDPATKDWKTVAKKAFDPDAVYKK